MFLPPALQILAFSKDYLRSIFNFAGGGDCFPILPSLQICAVLALVWWLLPKLASQAFFSTGSRRSFLALAVIVCAMPLPAALGRCDAGHVFINSMPVIVLGLGQILALPNQTKRCGFVALYIFIFVFLLIALTALLSRKVIYSAWVEREHPTLTEHWMSSNALRKFLIPRHSSVRPIPDYGKSVKFNDDEAKLLKYDQVGTPLGSDENLDRFLKSAGRTGTSYFSYPMPLITNSSDLQRTLSEIDHMRIIVVPVEKYKRTLRGLLRSVY